MLRTHNCGQLREGDAGIPTVLCGWVHALRDQKRGGLYLDLRDRWGFTQLRVPFDRDTHLYERLSRLRRESVLQVSGQVCLRPEGMVNEKIATGGIEVDVVDATLLNDCAVLPLDVRAHRDELASEEVRLKYRYLDLRRPEMQRRLILRSRVADAVRDALKEEDFVEVETPLFMRSTPEGSRDFVVPSRTWPGQFYALPQSPQIYKQLLMVAGYDRYFQLARCFRDEDARRERQLVHTQIDLEMSFVEPADVFHVVEKFLARVGREVLGVDIPIPFPRHSYAECMRRWGLDKPDLRFGLELQTIEDLLLKSPLELLREAQALGKICKAIRVPGGAGRVKKKTMKAFESLVRTHDAGGIFSTKYKNGGFATGAAKHIPETAAQAIVERMRLEEGDLLLFVTDRPSVANKAMGNLRNSVAEFLGLRSSEEWKFLWVVDFPLFEIDDHTGDWGAMHHMFSMPRPEYLGRLREDPGEVIAQLYDVVLNGVELGSGSIRIHDPKVQLEVMDICGIPEGEARRRFGFLIEALQSGAPPHGGIALGLDNLVMSLLGETDIREVIAFPNNSKGRFPNDGSPAPLEPEQLSELHLRLRLPEAETS